MSEPVRIGVPTSRPNWVSLSPSSCFDLDADDREDRPDREADGEGDRAQPEGPLLVGLEQPVSVFIGFPRSIGPPRRRVPRASTGGYGESGRRDFD